MEETTTHTKITMVLSLILATLLTPPTTANSHGGAPDGIGDIVNHHPDSSLPLKQKVFMSIIHSSQKHKQTTQNYNKGYETCQNMQHPNRMTRPMRRHIQQGPPPRCSELRTRRSYLGSIRERFPHSGHLADIIGSTRARSRNSRRIRTVILLLSGSNDIQLNTLQTSGSYIPVRKVREREEVDE